MANRSSTPASSPTPPAAPRPTPLGFLDGGGRYGVIPGVFPCGGAPSPGEPAGPKPGADRPVVLCRAAPPRRKGGWCSGGFRNASFTPRTDRHRGGSGAGGAGRRRERCGRAAPAWRFMGDPARPARSPLPGRPRPAYLAHGRASGDRGGRCRPCAQPHAGAWTPEPCPHWMNPGGVGATASPRARSVHYSLRRG
jgi:hypothetical protein